MNEDRSNPAEPFTAEALPDRPAGAMVAGADGVPPAVSRSRKRRILGVAMPALLLIGALGGAGCYTAFTVDRADRTAEVTLWEKADTGPGEDPAAGFGKGRDDTALSRQLLPVPQAYRLGPDADEYGNDSSLTGRQATTLMKSIGKGTSGSLRREIDKQIDTLGIKGFTERTYAAKWDSVLVDISLIQMKNRTAVRRWYTSAKAGAGARKGPAIEGHEQATCFLGPRSGEDLESMECLAYDGELLVVVDAFGSNPLDTSAVAGLVGAQLDRLESPGKSV